MTTPRFKTYQLPPKAKAKKDKKSSRDDAAVPAAAAQKPAQPEAGTCGDEHASVEDAEEKYEEELPVLTTKQMHRLRHAQVLLPLSIICSRGVDLSDSDQMAYGRAQTYYIAHSTPTKHAFPIALALGIQTLLVWNSVFQALLCAAMWGYNRFNRPAWMTGVLIPLSFLCMIVASILIWKGAEWTKRKTEVSAAVWKMLKADQEEFERKRAEALKQAEQQKKAHHARPGDEAHAPHQHHHKKLSRDDAKHGRKHSNDVHVPPAGPA